MLFVKKILEILKKSEQCNKSELRCSNIIDEIVCMGKNIVFKMSEWMKD